MNTKIIAVLVIASVMLLYGVSTASALLYEAYCWDTVGTTKSCCYGSNSGSVYCVVDASSCYGSGISILCGNPATIGDYVSNAKKNGTQPAGCAKSGNTQADAWCSYSSCGCDAYY